MAVVMGRTRSPGFITAKTVGSYVPGLTRKAFEKYGFSTAALITDWERIAGPKLAASTIPERLKWPHPPASREAAGQEGGRGAATLVLRVDPARALEAEYGTAQLIDRINTYFGYRAVAQVRLIQAPVEAPAARPAPSRRPAPVAEETPPAALPAGEDARLGAALARLAAGVRRDARRS